MGGPSKQVGDEKLRSPLPHHMCDILSIYIRYKSMPTAFGAHDEEHAPVQPHVRYRQSRLVYNIFYLL